MSDKRSKVLFVRSGGGAPGIQIHYGIWRALDNSRIVADEVVGNSAGAIVSAMDACGHGPFFFSKLMHDLKDSDFRRERFLWRLRGLFWIDSFLDPDPVLAMLARFLPADYRALKKPASFAVTREDLCQSLYMPACLGCPPGSGLLCPLDLPQMVYASMAIPGVWPPLETETGIYSDGGTTADLPIPSNWREYGQVWLCIADPPYRYAAAQATMITRFLTAAHMMLENQVDRSLFSLGFGPHQLHFSTGDTDVFVIRPDVGGNTGALRFGPPSLIDDAYDATMRILKEIDRA